MSRTILISIALTLMILSCGCSMTSSSYSVLQPSAADTIQADLISKLAGNAANTLHWHYPADTGFEVVHDTTAFGLALENAIRQKGFAVGKARQNLKLNYTVDKVKFSESDEPVIYMAIKVSDGFCFSVVNSPKSSTLPVVIDSTPNLKKAVPVKKAPAKGN
ncbi:hypothetical protein LJB93_02010 [Desulfovibrio sp. OttesenSCG-928-F07]|nr:hypothetical protein [Desulfovibrio sp. OttesenSCG-928-F07]